jgi:hypothetical protein
MAKDPLIFVNIVLNQDVIAWLVLLHIDVKLKSDLSWDCAHRVVKCLASANLVLCPRKWQRNGKFGLQK